MPLEPALTCYAGLACWALSTHRLRRELALPALPAPAALRTAGILLLAIGAWRAVHHFGPYQGAVALVGLASLAGMVLLLLLSYRPRLAVAVAVVALLLAAASGWDAASAG